VQKAAAAKVSFDMLEQVGLIARREEGNGHYARFRDRVMFPIRDVRGQTVGFGGRVLPSSPAAAKGPKYYNSAETPLFSKSDQLYGVDQARQAAVKAGYLAVVEGYTDVMMAHQHGIQNVVATMGTAFNQRHVRKIRGVAPRVVLVFDADAGGTTGVDRALEVFVSQEMDLRIATLPVGLDPCDLLTSQGPEPFRQALEQAPDALDYKLANVMNNAEDLHDTQAAVERMLAVLAAAPAERGVKMELMVNRIAHRLGLKEETVWTRLKEIRARRAGRAAPRSAGANEPERATPAAKHEIELLEALLADGTLVAHAVAEVAPAEVEHPELRQLLELLYRLHAEGRVPDVDHLRGRLDDERLLDKAELLRERGLSQPDRGAYLRDILDRIRERRQLRRRQHDLKTQVQAAPDHDTARELLKKLHSSN
jgi:DNA primase